MIIHIDKNSGVPVFRQVVTQVKRQILAGSLRAGEQLVSVRDLSMSLKVNPMTISKAYAILELEKLVERRRGIGLFVLPPGNSAQAARRQVLEEALERGALSAVQLGFSLKEGKQVFEKLYRKYFSGNGGNSDD